MRVAGFFMWQQIRHYPLQVILAVGLSLLSLGTQLGFLAVLPAVVQELTGAPQSGTALPIAWLESMHPGLPAMTAILVGLMLAAALSDFLLQWVVARTNVHNFRRLMRQLVHRLVAGREQRNFMRDFGIKPLINQFTKGCRYGSLIGYRTFRLVRPVLAIPGLLAFCLWHSPLLTAFAGGVLLLAAPFHAAVLLRSLEATRRLLRSGAKHSASKKSLVMSLLQFPAWDVMDAKRLEEEGVDRGSEDYFKAYLDRRLVASQSTLVSAVAAAIGIAAVFGLFEGFVGTVSLSFGVLLAFLLAMRLLIQNIGQLLTDFTMLASCTPLCEDLYDILTGRGANPARPSLPPPAQAELKAGSLPGLVVFAPMPLTVTDQKALVAELSGDPAWLAARVVRGDYPPHFLDLRRDLLLEEGAQEAPLPLPLDVAQAQADALERERGEGWSESLWDEVTPSVRIHATLNAALAKGADRIILVGPVQAQLGRAAWDELVAALLRRGVQAVQMLELPPKRLAIPQGIDVVFFDGAGAERFSAVQRYDEVSDDLRDRHAAWQRKQGTLTGDETAEADADDVLI